MQIQQSGNGAYGFQIWDVNSVASGLNGTTNWTMGNIPPAEQANLATMLAIPDASHWINGGPGVTNGYATTMETGQTSPALVGSLYLHSDLTSSTIAPNGSRTVLRRIPITVDFGSVLHDPDYYAPEDSWITLGKRTLKRMRFSLRDIHGQEIEFASNTPWSFSLCFARKTSLTD